MAAGDETTREDHLREVDRVLLYIAEARMKAEEMAAALERDGADDRFVAALQTTAGAMGAEHKRLMNATFYSVPDEQVTVEPAEIDPGQERMAV